MNENRHSLQIGELLSESTGVKDAQIVRMKRVRIADQFVRVEQPLVKPELSYEQIESSLLLFIDELLQAFAGATQREHILVAEMLADPVQNQHWQIWQHFETSKFESQTSFGEFFTSNLIFSLSLINDADFETHLRLKMVIIFHGNNFCISTRPSSSLCGR